MANAGRLAGSVIGAFVAALLGLGIGLSLSKAGIFEDWSAWITLGASLLGFTVGFPATALVVIPSLQRLGGRLTSLRPEAAFSGTIGALVGVILSGILIYAFAVASLAYPWNAISPGLIVLTLTPLGAWAGASRATQVVSMLARGAASPTPAAPVSVNGAQNGRCILVDTSAIIDGRIAEITHTGFVDGDLLIPRFVLEELQYVADSPDSLKRNRGRRGLDVLNRLQKDHNVEVQITEIDVPDQDGVDSKLVSLAKRSAYSLLTTDFNLNKVAELQGIKVLNINDLANSLKPTLIPGEELNLHITQEGKEETQGVGFLDDGTMVVVEGGHRYLNSQLPVVITRVLQTSAGRIIFAHLK